MRLLLDTHILLWALAASDRLPQDARTWLESEENVVLFSAASIWEIAIKAQVRRADFDADPVRIAAEARAAAFIELPVRAHHAAAVDQLPLHIAIPSIGCSSHKRSPNLPN